jgi:hypothetical protein
LPLKERPSRFYSLQLSEAVERNQNMSEVAKSFLCGGVSKSFFKTGFAFMGGPKGRARGAVWLRAIVAVVLATFVFMTTRSEAQSVVFEKWTETTPLVEPNSPAAMATDSAGNVIVVGNWGDQPLAIKYDTRGNTVWKNWLSSQAIEMTSGAVAVAVDAADDVFVLSNLNVTISLQESNISDTALAKYNAAGVRQWVIYSIVNTPGVALAVTPVGEVYVLGWNQSGGMVTAKYDANGTQIWARDQAVAFDESVNAGGPIAIRLDGQGNVYVAANNGLAGEILRYDPNGNLLNMIGEGQLGVVQGYRVDAAGNSYVLGGAAGTQDRIVAKFGPAGTLEWLNDLGPETDSQTEPEPRGLIDDTLKDVGLDAAGNVYILQDEPSVPATPSGVDMVATKFSASGVVLWTSRFNSSADHSATDEATALAVSSAGEAYVTGVAAAPSPVFFQTTTVKYNTTGAQVWVQSLELEYGNEAQQSGAVAIALGAGGQLFVVSTGIVGESWVTTDYVQDPAEVKPASVAFGNQTVGTPSAETTVALRNAGNAPMMFRTINVTGNISDFHLGNNCPDTLQPGASCSLFLTFTPSALGQRTATVIVRDNWPGNATDPTTITLTGTGIAP